jgi:PAS domain S-box-containing protein
MRDKLSGPARAAELEELRARLAETEGILRAIRNGEVGAVMLSADGVILYCNARLAKMLEQPLDQVLGSALRNYLPRADQQALDAILAQAPRASGDREINLKTSGGRLVPVYLSASRLQNDGAEMVFCLVLTDLTEQKGHELIVASEVRYRRLFESAKDGILILDADTGMVVDVNPFLVELLGFSHEAFLGKRVWELGFFKDVIANQASFAELQQQEYIRFEDKPLKTTDGRRIDVEFVSNIYQVNHQKVIQCNIRDITERKRAEEALARQSHRNQVFLRNASDGVHILDADGNVLEVSDSFCRMLGYSREELIGTNVSLWDAQWSPQELKQLVAEQIAKGDHSVIETRHRRRDRSVLDVEVTGQGLELDGKPALFNSARDITERKRAEEARAQSERQLKAIFDAAADGILLAETETRRFRSANGSICRMLGYSQKEMLNLSVSDIHPKEDLPHVLHEFERQARGDIAVVTDVPVKRKDGSVFFTDVNSTRMTIGGKAYLLGIFRDITERKRAEEKLARLNQQNELVLRSAAEGIMGLDLQGNHIFVNPAAAQMLGYEAEELLGRHSHSTWHHTKPDGSPYPREECEIYSAYRDGTVHRVSTEVFWRKDGTSFPVEYTSTPIWEQGRLAGAVVTFTDITERKRSEETMFRATCALKARSDCNLALLRASDEGWLLNEICRIVVVIAGYHHAWVGFAEHDPQKTIRPVAHAGYGEGFMERAEITWDDTASGHGPAGTAIRTREPQIVQDAHTDPRYELWRDNAIKIGYRSVLCLPLDSAGTALGALCIYASDRNGFDAEQIQLLSGLANDLAFGIVTLRTRTEHRQGEERLRRGMESTIEALAGTLEMRDAYTAGHQRRVAELAAKIAGELGSTEDEIHGIHLAGTVHDLGKIQVPTEILTKPTKLTKLEYELVKTHAQGGYDLLKDIDFPWPIAQIVYQHHERLDGSGYPRGLKGHEILLGARILAVADTVEAMSSHRPYRAGLGIDMALDEITKNRSTIYDAAVVDACVKLFRDKQFEFSG